MVAKWKKCVLGTKKIERVGKKTQNDLQKLKRRIFYIKNTARFRSRRQDCRKKEFFMSFFI
jgi:hypothetical protein